MDWAGIEPESSFDAPDRDAIGKPKVHRKMRDPLFEWEGTVNYQLRTNSVSELPDRTLPSGTHVGTPFLRERVCFAICFPSRVCCLRAKRKNKGGSKPGHWRFPYCTSQRPSFSCSTLSFRHDATVPHTHGFNCVEQRCEELRDGHESCPLRTCPKAIDTSLRDMEAGGSTLESGSFGFSMSGDVDFATASA